MTQMPIDLDSESIQYEGHWYTRDELAKRIKSMLDGGDFAVGKPSQALEQLTVTLSTLRTLAFKVTPDMADAVNQAAARQGRSVGGLIREAISDYLGFAAMPNRDSATAPPRLPERVGRKTTDPEVPAVTVPHTGVPSDLKTTQQINMPIAGPGALKAAQVPVPSVVIDRASIITEDASPEEAEGAVSLKPKQKEAEEPVERGWFGR